MKHMNGMNRGILQLARERVGGRFNLYESSKHERRGLKKSRSGKP
jgi:hypothetical protein